VVAAPEGWDRGRMGELWGRGARFGVVAIDARRLYWFAVLNAPPRATFGGTAKSVLLDRFAGFHPDVSGLIAATPDEAILHNDISDRPPSRRWGSGRVTLLGDAAHATTPNLGQGACQAMEDGVVLSACLARDPGPGGLRAYELARMDRTRRVTETSWRLGRVAQWENRFACVVRDAMMRLVPASVITRQTRELWRFELP
jgi:2-polyprenyl-6-methoxyphenol hydroxylase-like FAD-dependent oxidoreductase